MNPYTHHQLVQLHQAELRREAELHRLAAAARRSRGHSWWARFISGPITRTTPRPGRPTALRPTPAPTPEAVGRAA